MPDNMAENMAENIASTLRVIPRHCFQIDEWRAYRYFLRDLFLFVFSAFIIFRSNWYIALLASTLMGNALSSLFTIGHECGHGSFSRSKKINHIVGHITCTLGLWPFHVWRHTHNLHHRYT